MSVVTRRRRGPRLSSTSIALRPPAWLAILRAGLVSGALDITAAIVVYARFTRTVPMLQGIASGILGRDAFSGGLATAGLGLLCHFSIATSAAAVYFAASRRLPVLLQHAVVAGAAYGVFVYFFMQLVVIPLSAIGPHPLSLHDVLVGVAIHIPCVGVPIALTLSYYAPASRVAAVPPATGD